MILFHIHFARIDFKRESVPEGLFAQKRVNQFPKVPVHYESNGSKRLLK